jgi:hypothetical protein
LLATLEPLWRGFLQNSLCSKVGCHLPEGRYPQAVLLRSFYLVENENKRSGRNRFPAGRRVVNAMHL